MKQDVNKISIQDRVYLKRIRLFFGHGAENVLSGFVGGMVAIIVLDNAGVDFNDLVIWGLVLSLIFFAVYIVEIAFARAELTLENAPNWVLLRTGTGSLVGVMFGLLPFLFGDNLLIHHEMFLFIVLSAMISVASTGYTLMPYYYLTLNCLTMLPLSIYFFLQGGWMHNMLGVTALCWQIFVLSKSWRVSKTAINEVFLNESLRDEIEQHELTKEKLQHLANHDDLTGLPNRQFLYQRLDFLMKRAIRYQKSIAVMFVDLDGFKSINDQFGHDSGDYLLREISQRLQSTIRDTDIVTRHGGDEFVLVYTDLEQGVSEAEFLAERLLKLMRQPLELKAQGSQKLSGSIGVVMYPGYLDQIDMLLNAADEAMYASKARGKNCYTIATPEADLETVDDSA